MRYNTIIKLVVPLLAILVSCSEDMLVEGEGYVALNVIHDVSVDIVPLTKSEGAGLQIYLKIVDSEGNVDYESKDFGRVNGPIKLNTGRYTVTASAGAETQDEISESPFYRGTATFEVEPNAVSNIDLVCSLTTVKVTVAVSDEIKSNFEYQIEVTNGRSSAFFEEDTVSDDREVYFIPTGKLSWIMTLLNDQGETFVLKDSYVSVKAQQHYALSFSLEGGAGDKVGAGEFKIIVDDMLNAPKIHDVTLVIDKSAPTMSGQSSVSKLSCDAYVGADYHVNSSLPFSSMAISHSDAAMLEAGLPQNIDIFSESSAASVLAEAGVLVGIFANGYTQQAMDATTTDIRLNFDGLFNSLPVGHYDISLSAANASGKDQVMHISLDVLPSLNVPAVEPWGEFMYVKTSWICEACPSDLKMQYRLTDSEEWIDFVPSSTAGELYIDEAGKTIRAFICGLSGNTAYDVRVVTGKEMTDLRSVSTQSVEQLYNMNFNEWANNTTPYASGKGGIWDTANPGTDMLGIYPTSRETSDVISGSAVRMESMYKVKFAAGNIYTGKFGKAIMNLSNPGAELYWGLQFTARPVGLKGWYKYRGVTINRTDKGYDSLKGQPDKGQILFGLFTNWTSQFHIKTNESRFVDFSESNKDIVATRAILIDNTDGWIPFTMAAGYRKDNLRKPPTYIVTTACASYKGDYFTGGEGSVLLVDEFSYIYDPMLLNAEDRAEFFSLFD